MIQLEIIIRLKNNDPVIINNNLFIENSNNIDTNNNNTKQDTIETLLGLGNITTETIKKKLFDEKVKDLLKT